MQVAEVVEPMEQGQQVLGAVAEVEQDLLADLLQEQELMALLKEAVVEDRVQDLLMKEVEQERLVAMVVLEL
jgi:hypothetical protein